MAELNNYQRIRLLQQQNSAFNPLLAWSPVESGGNLRNSLTRPYPSTGATPVSALPNAMRPVVPPPVIRGAGEEKAFISARDQSYRNALGQSGVRANPFFANINVAAPGTSASRAQDISKNAITGLYKGTGRLNIDTANLGKGYTNVSPEFAATAGIPQTLLDKAAGAATINPTEQAQTRAQVQAVEGKVLTQRAQDNINASNSLISSRPNVATQPIGLTDNDKMSRYGTRFPDQLPINPTLRDLQNQKDYLINSSRVPTSSRTSGAAAGVYNY